jgi:hypothetical protein
LLPPAIRLRLPTVTLWIVLFILYISIFSFHRLASPSLLKRGDCASPPILHHHSVIIPHGAQTNVEKQTHRPGNPWHFR